MNRKLIPDIILFFFILCLKNKASSRQYFPINATPIYDGMGQLNCSRYIVEDEFILLENGTLFLRSSQELYDNTKYFLANESVHVCVPSERDDDTTNEFSDEFASCMHILLDADEYKVFDNGSIYVAVYNTSYELGNYVIADEGLYVCQPPYEEMHANVSSNATVEYAIDKFPENLTYVTYTGLSISIVCLLAHLIVFCTVSAVRNLPGCCLASLSVSLLLAYICFLTVSFAKTKKYCSILGMCIYYFFLSSFFWMNAISFDVWRSFRVVMKELRISSHKVPRRRFCLYFTYSCIIPAVLTALVKIFDSADWTPSDLKPSFGDPICWFGQRKSLLVFFAAPLIIVMLMNAAFFLDVTVLINRHTFKSSQSNDATVQKRFFMFMRLALVMGLTWIVGIVAGYADIKPMWYLFIVLNTLQGLFIFVVFSCSSKVRRLFCLCHVKRTKRRSTSVRTITQAI